MNELEVFRDMLLQAIDFALANNRNLWAGFLFTIISVIEKGSEEEFTILCERYLKAALEEENEEHIESLEIISGFFINRRGDC